jgi:hypothetical protein
MMIIGGTCLTELEVATLAFKLLDAEMNACVGRLVKAHDDGEPVFSFSTEERARILRCLDECPDELLPLRTSLREPLS